MANLIATADICTYHNVEYTFINSLSDAGLLKVKMVRKNAYISEAELQKLERMIRLHHDLDINIAGIEAIIHLLERVERMQEEMRHLRSTPV